MQSEATHYSGGEPHHNDITTCLNCRAAMPREMRFCRACGQRLGEGLAEYVETIRFDSSTRAAVTTAANHAGQNVSASPETHGQRKATIVHEAKFFGTRETGGVVQGTLKGVEELFKNLEKSFKQNQVKLSAQTSRLSSFGCGGNAFRFNRTKNERIRRNKRQSATGLTWTSFWIALAVFFTLFVALTSSDSRHRNRDARAATTQTRAAAIREKVAALRQAALDVREEVIADASGTRSMIGISDLKSANGLDGSGGAFIESVTVPGSPADKAGLVGGDIITGFDTQRVKSAGDLSRLLATTPAGKSVNVSYLRDGETKQTTLLTASKAQIEQLTDAWEEAADKHGALGLDDSDFARINVPGTNLYGVRLGEVEQHSAAGLAGLREKDLLIEFDGTPIRTAEELDARIKRAVPGKAIKAVIMRGAERLEIPVTVDQND